MNQQVNHPELGHYKGGEPARIHDVVVLNSGSPEMTVQGYNKCGERFLLCDWRGDGKTESGTFKPVCLTLIRRAPTPAQPAYPQGIQQSAAPKVTPADVEAAIASEHYYTGVEGAYAAWQKTDEMEPPNFTPLRGLMHCALVTHNGHVVTGEALLQDLSKPDPERAKASARRRAFDKLYDMVVYAARERQAKATISSTDHTESHEWRVSPSYGGQLCANCGAVKDSRRGKALCAPPTQAAN